MRTSMRKPGSASLSTTWPPCLSAMAATRLRPETVARCGAAGVQPIERTKHPLTFRACYTGPVVLHPKCQHLTRYRRAEISFRPVRRVQAGVLDEIAEHLNQQFAIAVEGKVAAMG